MSSITIDPVDLNNITADVVAKPANTLANDEAEIKVTSTGIAVKLGDTAHTVASGLAVLAVTALAQLATTNLATHVARVDNPHTVTKAQVGLGNADNTSDLNKPISTAATTALAAKADLVGGVVPTAQIPQIAIVDFLGEVASQAAMLALTGQKGDWCTRTDLGKVYVITGNTPTQLSSWTVLTYPASPVTSVAGHVGDVTLAMSDIGGLVAALTGKEAVLGNPASNGRVLASTTLGVRSWVDRIADGEQIFDDTHSLFLDSGERKIYAPNGTDVWIDLSGGPEHDGQLTFPAQPTFSAGLQAFNGVYFDAIVVGNSSEISIGDNSGSAAYIDADGNIFTNNTVAVANYISLSADGSAVFANGGFTIDIDGNLIAATLSGSGTDLTGHATGFTAGFADYGNNVFDNFFSNWGQSSSGSSNVFLQTDGTFSGTFRGIWFDQDDHQFVFNYGVLQPTSDSGFSSQDGLTYFDNSGFRGSISSRDGYTTLDDAGILVVFGSVTVGTGGAAINISPSGISGLSLLFAATSAFKLGGTDYYPHVAAGVLSFTSTP